MFISYIFALYAPPSLPVRVYVCVHVTWHICFVFCFIAKSFGVLLSSVTMVLYVSTGSLRERSQFPPGPSLRLRRAAVPDARARAAHPTAGPLGAGHGAGAVQHHPRRGGAAVDDPGVGLAGLPPRAALS